MAKVSMLWFVLAFVLVAARPQAGTQLPTFLKYENCGPPFNLTVHPIPLKVREEVTFTVDFIAACDMISGVVECYINTWPYHYKDIYCDFENSLNHNGCYISKGERKTLSASIWVDDDYKQKEYVANATVTNEHGEVMLCVRARLLVDEMIPSY